MSDTTTGSSEGVMEHQASAALIAREEAAFVRAAEADERVNGKHFEDWVAISEGLAALRDRAMRDTDSNRPYGKAYTQKYGALKRDHPWAGHYDAVAASHACWLHDNLTVVLQWRGTLGENQRRDWITPRAIHQHYERMTKIAKKATPSSASRENNAQTIIRLQEENDMLRKKGGGGLMPGATVEVLVEEIIVAHNPRFIRRLITALQKRVEQEERQDGIEAQRAKKTKPLAAGPTPAQRAKATQEVNRMLAQSLTTSYRKRQGVVRAMVDPGHPAPPDEPACSG